MGISNGNVDHMRKVLFTKQINSVYIRFYRNTKEPSGEYLLGIHVKNSCLCTIVGLVEQVMTAVHS